LSKRADSRQDLLNTARSIFDKDLVVGTVGNVSLRVGDEVIITPSRVPYSEMEASDLVRVSLSGEPLEGGRPSQELPLHLAVYRRRPDLRALLHTHSPHATAWSFLAEPLLPVTEENGYYGIGDVLTSPPAPSGSTQLAEAAAKTLGESLAVLLGRHGVLAAGTNLAEALDVALVVERQAQIALLLAGKMQVPGRRPEPAHSHCTGG
jgi:L-fuculose-phosphate aldolase